MAHNSLQAASILQHVQLLRAQALQQFDGSTRNPDLPAEIVQRFWSNYDECRKEKLEQLSKNNQFNATIPYQGPINSDSDPKSFADKIKDSWNNWQNDTKFRQQVLASVKRCAKNTLFSVALTSIQYTASFGYLLLEEGFELSNRIGKFFAGLAIACLQTGVLAVVISAIIEVLAPCVPHTVAKFLVPAIGPIIATVISVIRHLCTSDLSKVQKAEAVFIDIVEGAIFFAISFIPPPANWIVGGIVAIILAVFMTDISAEQRKIGLTSDGDGPLLCQIIWRKLSSSAPDVPEDLVCELSREVMKEPVVLNGRYYDKKVITSWVKERGTDPEERACTTKDIRPCSEMRRYIQRYLSCVSA